MFLPPWCGFDSYKGCQEGWQSLAYCNGLENRRSRKRSLGSNPSPSAKLQKWRLLCGIAGIGRQHWLRISGRKTLGFKPLIPHHYARLTQLGECYLYKVEAVGSSPTPSTKYERWIRKFGAIAQSGERLLCTQEVEGSIPFSSTIRLYNRTTWIFGVAGARAGLKNQRMQFDSVRIHQEILVQRQNVALWPRRRKFDSFISPQYRDVAQLGRARRLGRWGRRFEFCHPD